MHYKYRKKDAPAYNSDEHDLDFMDKDTEMSYSDSNGLLQSPTLANNLAESYTNSKAKSSGRNNK